MADRVFPSRPQTGAVSGNPNYGGAKPQLYNPAGSAARCTSCRCCIWTAIFLLSLILLAGVAAVAVYLIYRPLPPDFSLASLRITRFNISGAASGSQHLSSTLSLAVSARNPNGKVGFLYGPIVVSAATGELALGKSAAAGFEHGARNTTVIRATVGSSQDVDAESLRGVRSDLRRRRRVAVVVRLEMAARVRIGGVESREVGVRVICGGVQGVPPDGGKAVPSIAPADPQVKCAVHLRVKIWKFSF